MKKKLCLPVFVFTLMFVIAAPSCKKQKDLPVLENTTWKLTREIWTFPNGNTEIFEKQSDGDGVFTWFFSNNNNIRILWLPYTYEESGTWNLFDNRITTSTRVDPSSMIQTRHFKIVEHTNSFMKVDAEGQGGSSINGQTSNIYYELARQ